MNKTAIILSGGGPAPRPHLLPETEVVIAADSGLHLAAALDLRVDVIVGDLDSADPALVEEALRDGASLEAHSPDKDATDLDLAFEAAIERGVDHIAVVGGGAGRLDHLLGVALLVASPRWTDVRLEWYAGTSVAYAVHDSIEIATEPGDLVSILPVSPTTLISIGGTRWALEDEPLEFGSTRGLSNEATGESARITVRRGSALVVHTPR